MRCYSLDSLKCLCAVLIVFLHVRTPYSACYLPLTRCAVPCFLLVSGYLLMGPNMEGRIIRSSQRILKLIVWSSILFAFVEFIKGHGDFTSVIPSRKDWFDFFVFNDNPWGFHLWYLGAYLYVLFICFFIERYKLWHFAFLVVPFLLSVDLVIGKYSLVLWGRQFPYIYVRNFMFVGLPYFLLGCFIKQRFDMLMLKRYFMLFLSGVVLFSITSFMENRFLVSIGLNAIRDHYISTTFLSISLFLLFLSVELSGPSKMSEWGRKYSLYLYIFHPLSISCLAVIVGHLPWTWCIQAYHWLAPIVVAVCTFAGIFVLDRCGVLKVR